MKGWANEIANGQDTRATGVYIRCGSTMPASLTPPPRQATPPRTGYRSGDNRDERRRTDCRALDRSLILSAKCPPADRFMPLGHGSQSAFCMQEQLQRDKTTLCLKLTVPVAVLIKGCKPQRIVGLLDLSTPGGMSLSQSAGAAVVASRARYVKWNSIRRHSRNFPIRNNIGSDIGIPWGCLYLNLQDKTSFLMPLCPGGADWNASKQVIPQRGLLTADIQRAIEPSGMVTPSRLHLAPLPRAHWTEPFSLVDLPVCHMKSSVPAPQVSHT
ncbi:hypothetical protein BKA64DRAFT_208052 [Cadophora sp. MPI-SDFR-AT-0126]|nr:hypothetical protein BKA64DRAFT_208052 [Leotiomycetes sp. MPI-SDFR-AT-0126]